MAEARKMSPEKITSIDKSNLGDFELNENNYLEKLYETTNPGDLSEHLMKKEKAIKSIKKLLRVSEQYSSYCNDTISKVLAKSEQERVDAMMKLTDSASNNSLENIPFFKGVLKDYQVVGVQWLKTLFEHGVNGILADEMGLGKTVQVIALICYLIEKIKGPFLIVVPLSTLPNWRSEFKRFAPEIPVVIYHGDKEQRLKLVLDIAKVYRIGKNVFRPVVITTVQMVALEMKIFKQVTWKYLIMDEGHCLKNPNTVVSHNMRTLTSLNKLILTGTPLQNNLKELWSILNFIMPKIFNNMDTFSSLFLLGDFDDNSKIVKEEQTSNVISSLHKIIQPFMLRRLKSEVLQELVPKKEVLVYCPLTNLQRTLYTYIIKRNIAALNGMKDETEKEVLYEEGRPKRKCASKYRGYQEEGSDDEFLDNETAMAETNRIMGANVEKEVAPYIYNIKLQNPLMMFKKVVNHPHLVHTPVTPERTLLIDERLITESGKMLVLDVMLSKLKKRKHKVLIFSTLVMMLDLIEEFMVVRNHTYCRLDGNTSLDNREEAMKEFNTNKNIFAFLISTRAGGLGLNLMAADTVIIFDRDWNPQVDIQAQDRCHRIGQTKPVVVYSLITKNTIDDRILYCSNMKKKLETVIIKGGKFSNPVPPTDKDLDMENLLKILEIDDSSLIIHRNSDIFSDAEWDKLLDRSDLYEQMEKRRNAK